MARFSSARITEVKPNNGNEMPVYGQSGGRDR